MMRYRFKMWKRLYICCLISVATIFLLSLRKGPELPCYEQWMQLKGSYADKHDFLYSEWTKYFPSLMKAVRYIDENSKESITSARNTRIELVKDERDNYVLGDIVNAKIIAFDNSGRRKKHGGDFIIAILRRPNSKTDGVACNVLDKTDGTYSVKCILPWEGDVLLTAVLAHPSESVFQIMLKYSTERHYGLDIVTTMLNSNGVKETTICAVDFRDKSSDDLCDYTNPSHGEKRKCLKPPSGECSKIVDQVILNDPLKTTHYDDTYFVKGFNFHVPISGSGMRLQIGKNSVNKPKFPSTQELCLDPMTPTGFWFNSSWNSIKSRKRVTLDQKSVKKCVQNKRLYFFGDSTVRIIYMEILNTLNLSDTTMGDSISWAKGRDAAEEKWNLTMQYRSHGAPLLNPGPEDTRPYISDSTAAIKAGGDGTVVIFTIGYHFLQLNPEVFLNRIQIIKNCIADLIARLPGTKVVFKGLHYHSVVFADRVWSTYRLEILLRNEFKDVKGVTYLESWDYTMVYNNPELHPESQLLEPIISDFLGTFC